jgi:hypothetical protein
MYMLHRAVHQRHSYLRVWFSCSLDSIEKREKRYNSGFRENFPCGTRTDNPAAAIERAGACSKHLQRDDRRATHQPQRIRAVPGR